MKGSNRIKLKKRKSLTNLCSLFKMAFYFKEVRPVVFILDFALWFQNTWILSCASNNGKGSESYK